MTSQPPSKLAEEAVRRAPWLLLLLARLFEREDEVVARAGSAEAATELSLPDVCAMLGQCAIVGR